MQALKIPHHNEYLYIKLLNFNTAHFGQWWCTKALITQSLTVWYHCSESQDAFSSGHVHLHHTGGEGTSNYLNLVTLLHDVSKLLSC